ncbi:LysE family translocator [Streptomyces adustus]
MVDTSAPRAGPGGAVHLLLPAVKAFRDRSAPGTQGAPSETGPRRVFRPGTVASLLNPKVILFNIAFLPQFVDPELGHVRRPFPGDPSSTVNHELTTPACQPKVDICRRNRPSRHPYVSTTSSPRSRRSTRSPSNSSRTRCSPVSTWARSPTI